MGDVKAKRKLWMPVALMAVFALTRWPGVLPPNSAPLTPWLSAPECTFPGKVAMVAPVDDAVCDGPRVEHFYYQTTPVDDRMMVNYGAYTPSFGWANGSSRKRPGGFAGGDCSGLFCSIFSLIRRRG